MKKLLDFIIPIKTSACYSFTCMVCIYAVYLASIDALFSPQTVGVFLIVSVLGAMLQTLAFSDIVIKKLSYTIRIVLFAVPFFLILLFFARVFHWFPVEQTSAWLIFCGIFLFIFLFLTACFEIYFHISGRKYDGLLGQYRAAHTPRGTESETSHPSSGPKSEISSQSSPPQA